MDDHTINILLVEDNPGDVRLTKEAFKECNNKFTINVVEDGVDALDYLFKRGKFTQAQRPDLILLDLNLPKKNGFEVLQSVKNHKDLHTIPVVILTTSKATDDINTCYDRYANCFLTKPVDLDQFIEMIKSFEEFWFDLVKTHNKSSVSIS